jgi:uncharacterized protein (DUF1778 family)
MNLAQPSEESGKSERIYARVTPRQKSLIQRAAELKGLSISDYMIVNLEREAEQTIATTQIIELTAKDSLKLVEMLLNPPEPSENMKKAARRYQELTQQGF